MTDSGKPAVCYSHIGKRSTHEDNFLFDGRSIDCGEQAQMADNRLIRFTSNHWSSVGFCAISDGMGGHSAGEVASRICVEKLAELEMTVQNCTSVREIVPLCQMVIADINATVCEMSEKNKELRGMGATLVLLIVCRSECAVLNVGDSRAYSFDGDSLIQITKDNTEGQRMLDLGLLTRRELANFPAKKNLSRYIGYNEGGISLHADEYFPQFKRGIMILCSDGITDALTDCQIAEILRSEKDMESAGMKILDMAVSNDYADNATVILVPIGW